ncbi:MAG: ABC transporter permease [Comamonas sp.]
MSAGKGRSGVAARPGVVVVTTGRARGANRLRAVPGWLWRHPQVALGGLLLAAIAVVALLGPLLYPGDPWEMVGAPLVWPGEDPATPLGTDLMGRDIVTGLVSGARVSLLVGLVSTVLAAVLGVLIGAVGGYWGGGIDNALMRLTEIFQTVPKFVLAVVLVAIFKPTIATEVIAIGVVSWPATARLARTEFMRLRNREFVLAARAMGLGSGHVIWRHILPNALGPVIVVATLTIATAIQTEAALAFLGLSDPNVMSWGALIGAGREQVVDAWYICALPGAAIVLTVLAFNLLGEGLGDAFNPRLRRRR